MHILCITGGRIGLKTMHILNKYFDKIYCVTVHNFYDRHTLVKNQLSGISFEWMLSPPAQNLCSSLPLSLSETSLILGHVSCIWNAKLNGYKKIAIWEDDGTLIATEEEMKGFFEELPINWDFLYMANASWNNGIWDNWDNWSSPYSENVRKLKWGTGSGFNAIQHHVYDEFIKQAMRLKDPIDFSYYNMFNRGNSYRPSKKFFSDPISMPNEHCLSRVSDKTRFIPSYITHRN